MNRKSTLTLGLVLLVSLAALACGPSKSDLLAAEKMAKQGGWIVTSVKEVEMGPGGENYNIEVGRQRTEAGIVWYQLLGYTTKTGSVRQVFASGQEQSPVPTPSQGSYVR